MRDDVRATVSRLRRDFAQATVADLTDLPLSVVWGEPERITWEYWDAPNLILVLRLGGYSNPRSEGRSRLFLSQAAYSTCVGFERDRSAYRWWLSENRVELLVG